jgi:hypothetical protein
MATLFAGRPCIDPTILYKDCVDRGLPVRMWHGKANLFRCPNGRGPGRGQILLTQEDIEAIDRSKSHTLTFLDDRGHETLLKSITLTRAACIAPGAADLLGNVYLCDLEDRRRDLARIPIDRAFNVRKSDGSGYLTSTLNSGTAWTWQQVVQNLFTLLGLGTAATLSPVPHGTPENLVYYGRYAWDALHDVLDRLAWTIRPDLQGDKFNTLVQLGNTSASSAKQAARQVDDLYPDRTWQTYTYDPNRGWAPEKVRVRFQRLPKPTDGNSPYYNVDISTSLAGAATGTYLQIDDDLIALGNGSTPTNSANLTARATERAADWKRKRQKYDSPNQVTWGDFAEGLGNVTLSGIFAEVAWDDRGGPMRTEAASRPDGSIERWKTANTFAGEPGGGTQDCAVFSGLNPLNCLAITITSDSGCGNITPGTYLLTGNSTSSVWSAEIETTLGANTTFNFTPGNCSTFGFATAWIGAFSVPGETEEDPPTEYGQICMTLADCSGGGLVYKTGLPWACSLSTACPTSKVTVTISCSDCDFSYTCAEQVMSDGEDPPGNITLAPRDCYPTYQVGNEAAGWTVFGGPYGTFSDCVSANCTDSGNISIITFDCNCTPSPPPPPRSCVDECSGAPPTTFTVKSVLYVTIDNIRTTSGDCSCIRPRTYKLTYYDFPSMFCGSTPADTAYWATSDDCQWHTVSGGRPGLTPIQYAPGRITECVEPSYDPLYLNSVIGGITLRMQCEMDLGSCTPRLGLQLRCTQTGRGPFVGRQVHFDGDLPAPNSYDPFLAVFEDCLMTASGGATGECYGLCDLTVSETPP